ncbi:MAG: TolC family protein [Elusimicrobia bacterium]|nr:TolC family protein [Elusimicrobiota bacterium]
MKRSSLALFCLLLSPLGSRAEVTPCPRALAPKGILECALQLHPDIRTAQTGVQADQEGVAAAKQRANPELNSQLVTGGPADRRFDYAEFNFAHVFELGGKRSARAARGEAELERGQAELLAARESVFSETWLALNRLGQIRDHLALIDEALFTYARVVKDYASRPALPPELSVSRRVLELAQAGLTLKRAELQIEADAAARSVERAIGRVPAPDDVLPNRDRVWPELPEEWSAEPLTGSHLSRSKAEISDALSRRREAGAAAWPDFRLGPTIQRQTGSGYYTAYGVNFALSLPFYQRNAAGRRQADFETRRAELGLAAMEREERDERERAVVAYRASVSALKAMPSETSVSAQHEEIERLFARGLVTAPLLLEAHRQRLDLAEGRDERELAALAAYARLQALRGRLTEGAL